MITDNYNLNTKSVALWLLRITDRVTTTFYTASKNYNKIKCGLLILWDTIIIIDPLLPIHLMSSLGYEMVLDNVALTDAGLPKNQNPQNKDSRLYVGNLRAI